METVTTYILLFFIYSFLGWLMEIGVTIVQDHKLVNRGFLIGPYCPIYGFGCLLILILLKKYTSEPLLLFIMAIVICSLLEYITSLYMEKIFHARWWDYSNRKMNINGRICLETMIPFGILGMGIVYIVNPFLLKIIHTWPTNLIQIIAIFLTISLLIDFSISTKIIFNFRKEMKSLEKDYTEEISKKVREILVKRGYLHKRLISAFPHMETYREHLENLRKEINRNLNKERNKKD